MCIDESKNNGRIPIFLTLSPIKDTTMILSKDYSYSDWKNYSVKINNEIIHNVPLNGSLNFLIFENVMHSLTLKMRSNRQDIATIEFITSHFKEHSLVPSFQLNNLSLEDNKKFWEDKLDLSKYSLGVSYLDAEELEFKIQKVQTLEGNPEDDNFIDLDALIEKMIQILSI